MWYDVVLDALIDTLKLFPFLFLLYILIELMEHNTRVGKPNKALSGKWAPLFGSVVGLVPMCGFSVMAAKLYRHRHLTLGTLIAVFVATSDEAFLVLLLSSLGWAEKLLSIVALIGSKVVLGAGAGYCVDLILKNCARPPEVHELEAHAHEVHKHEEHGHEEEHNHAQGEEYTVCEHKHGKESTLSLYLVSPLLHALKIAAFVLAINLAFGFLFFGIGGGNAEAGEEKVIAFMQGAGYWYQPLIGCLIGLIPNCASSVVLAETYALGGIAFGSLLGGLCVNAGLGYLVLLRDTKKWKETLFIVGGLFLFSLAAGYVANAIALSF